MAVGPSPVVNDVPLHRQNAAPVAGELHFDSDEQGQWLIVRARGCVDLSTAALLRDRFRSAVRDGVLIVAHLADAHLADASGIAVLIGVHRQAQLVGKVFVVVAPTRQASQALRAPGLTERLVICPTFRDFLAWSGIPSPKSFRSRLLEIETGHERPWFNRG